MTDNTFAYADALNRTARYMSFAPQELTMPEITIPTATDINTALATLRDAMIDIPGAIIINAGSQPVLRLNINGDIPLDEDNTLAAIAAVAAIQRLR